ncbi:uroplakin-3b-like [Erpetoichthys calabaricus]|uniref:Uroplakin-3b-like n=1 Tax=Erpetoichthys calabaricus TaxID=27687 RepID=A0A8C4S8Y1_ERPCA|nr:uroplakin-3b-like [Erpetoichthys calabaricus]
MDLLLWVLLAVSIHAAAGQPTTLSPTFIPQISSFNYPGTVSVTTFQMKEPLCFFNFQLCSNQCNVWAVVASASTGVANFPSLNSLTSSFFTSSQYSAAFQANGLQYYMATVGNATSFTCTQNTPLNGVIRIGSNPTCTGYNCNGPVPPNTVVRVRYLLSDSLNTKIFQVTPWSSPIKLVTPLDYNSIDTWFGKRSGGMIVITSILSSLTGILLLLLVAMFLLTCSGYFQGKEDISTNNPTALGPVSMKQYSFHQRTATPSTTTSSADP